MEVRVCGCSVRGAAHVRSGASCQDCWLCDQTFDNVTIVAVADGHGSQSYPYSHLGAQFAVKAFRKAVVGALDRGVGGRDAAGCGGGIGSGAGIVASENGELAQQNRGGFVYSRSGSSASAKVTAMASEGVQALLAPSSRDALSQDIVRQWQRMVREQWERWASEGLCEGLPSEEGEPDASSVVVPPVGMARETDAVLASESAPRQEGVCSTGVAPDKGERLPLPADELALAGMETSSAGVGSLQPANAGVGRKTLPTLSEKQLRRSRKYEKLELRWQQLSPGEQKKRREDYRRRRELYSAFGTTLLGLVVTPERVLAFHIGDGSMVGVRPNPNERSRGPRAARLFADQTLGVTTNSLCAEDAWTYAEWKSWDSDDINTYPQLFMLSSDGFETSFVDGGEYHKACCDYYDLLVKGKFERVQDSLGEWLTEVSRAGSGDDVTLVLVYRPEK